jgi:uncharacterized protein YndB with AHSA1/START domain
LVNRPIEEVFAFLEEPESRLLYDDGVDSLEVTSPGPIGVGSRGVIRTSFLGRTYERPLELTEYDPPRKLVMASKARPFATWVGFELEGRDRLTWVELSVTGRPGGLSRMVEPLMAHGAEWRLRRVLAKLVRVLESGVRLGPQRLDDSVDQPPDAERDPNEDRAEHADDYQRQHEGQQ